MNENKWSKILIISGVILIFLTSFIYLMGCRDIIKAPMVLLSFLFVIVAEVVTVLIIVNVKKEVLRSSIITVTAIYLFVTIVLAIVFINFLMVFLISYLVINVMLIAITSILVMNLNIFASHVNKVNNKTLAANEIMSQCENRIQYYLNDSEYDKYKEQLSRIYEAIKYSDSSSTCGIEGLLLEKIEGISKSKEELSDNFKEILLILKERNMKVQNIKKGSI